MFVALFISTRFCYLGCCYAERHGPSWQDEREVCLVDLVLVTKDCSLSARSFIQVVPLLLVPFFS